MKLQTLLLTAALAAAAACSSSSQSQSSSSTPPPPAAAADAVQCAPTEFVAAGKCHPTADAACASLACPAECLQQETAPVQVRCKE